MSHRLRSRWLRSRRTAATVALLVAASAHPAGANPGILHKHGHRAPGAPMTLPGQALGAVAPANTTPAATGAATGVAATTGSTAVAGNASGSVGVAGIATDVVITPIDAAPIDPGGTVDGLPVCVMPPIATDAAPPVVMHHHRPGAVPGFAGSGGWGIDPGTGAGAPGPITTPPAGGPGFERPMVDGRLPDGPTFGGPMAPGAYPVDATTNVVTTAGSFPGPWPGGRDVASAQPMMASAPAGGATDATFPAPRSGAGGLPARAAGVRPDTAVVHRHHAGPGPAANRTAAGGTTGGDASTPSTGTGPAASSGVAAAAGVQTAGGVQAGTATAPRWRDRLRVVWPGSK